VTHLEVLLLLLLPLCAGAHVDCVLGVGLTMITKACRTLIVVQNSSAANYSIVLYFFSDVSWLEVKVLFDGSKGNFISSRATRDLAYSAAQQC
jgi:hypothetical protein